MWKLCDFEGPQSLLRKIAKFIYWAFGVEPKYGSRWLKIWFTLTKFGKIFIGMIIAILFASLNKNTNRET
jgi:hypothetical protein